MRFQASLGIILFAAVACSGRFISESDADACTDAIWKAHETVDWAKDRLGAVIQWEIDQGPPGLQGDPFWRSRWNEIESGVHYTDERLRRALREIEAAARACERPEDG